jgi:ABC-type glycerol-3-phosphate transport system substrate-binding protein
VQKHSFHLIIVRLTCLLGLSLLGLTLLGLTLLGLTAGCWNSQEGHRPQDGPPSQRAIVPRATQPVVTLKLLVVGDPELADGIKKLRGEWTERTGGGQLQVLQWSSPKLVAAESLPADLVIYPARYLGIQVEKKWLRPLRDSTLQSEQFAKADLLAAIRSREISYGGSVYAFPFGSPPLLLCYNSQALTSAGCEVPQTWDDYRIVVQRLNRQSIPCQLPLAGESAAITLLSRAVSYAHQGGQRTLLFDLDTFHPRIAGPPFVRALEEIVAEVSASKRSNRGKADSGGTVPAVSLPGVFQDAVKRVALGQAVMTLGWPGVYCPLIQEDGMPEERRRPNEVHYAPLPRAKTVYRDTQDRWVINRDDTPVTLLGVAGRLASVTTTSRNAVSAFKLLRWIGSGDTAIEISSDSRFTLWYRHSQVKVSDQWQANCQGLGVPEFDATTELTATIERATEKDFRRQGIGRVVTHALSSDNCFLLPRISGIDQYLECLSQAVRSAIAGESAKAALEQATIEWEMITEHMGREMLQLAYRAHLDY